MRTTREGRTGSSPRVRGTGGPVLGEDAEVRFIPARAGNSMARTGSGIATTVHPRACGEQTAQPCHHLGMDGSSPRVRGTAVHRWPGLQERRFIPARAGNSSAARPAPRDLPVHPRACGEQLPMLNVTGDARGSSPRVRGTAAERNKRNPGPRFIPARAGNRENPRPGPDATAVHPRACGEQDQAEGRLDMSSGSSPRVRGTGPADHQGFRVARFIPARAGNRCRNMT